MHVQFHLLQRVHVIYTFTCGLFSFALKAIFSHNIDGQNPFWYKVFEMSSKMPVNLPLCVVQSDIGGQQFN